MDEERVTFAEPFGFKFLDPAGCTYHNGEAFQYNLPQRGEKWSQPTMHPEPVEPDGRACGLGRLHQMAIMGANYAPVNWWPWWSRGVGGLVGQDDKKRGWHGLELRRVSPRIFARALRPPFCWGRGADLYQANLRWADLRWADLSGAKINHLTVGVHSAPEGDLIGWGLKSGHVVKLLIPHNSPRSCATTRKFRSAWVKTLEIDGGAARLEHSTEYGVIVYEVGEITHADSWDEDRWNECSHGIHFFLTQEEAEAWRT